MQQLQTSMPAMMAANASALPFRARPSYTVGPAKKSQSKPRSQSSDSSGAGLSRADAMKVLSQLKSIRAKVSRYEEERVREKAHLVTVRAHMRSELLAIKKQLMADNLRQTPKDFRQYLTSQLIGVKEQLLKAQNEKASQSQTASQSKSLSGNDSNILKRVKSELIGIRQETATKLGELAKHEQFSREFEAYKVNLQKKLHVIKGQVEGYEKELARTRKENEDFRVGNRIPSLLQEAITSKLCVLKEQVFQVETENKHLRMQQSAKDPILSLRKSTYVTTIDMHSGGQPLRIVEHGIPALSGTSLLEKRMAMMSKHDHFRRFLLQEPRGHFDMVGVVITEPDDPSSADFAALFMHNEGYSSMEGHAVLALGRYAIDFNLITNQTSDDDEKSEKEKIVRIQCPCGIVTVSVSVDASGRSTGAASFVSAPAWAEHISASIQLDQFGKVEMDIGFGGAYFAVCPSTRFNLNVRDSAMEDLINISSLIKQTVAKKVQLRHPESGELAFLYGVVLTDGVEGRSEASAQVNVFGDRQMDRSAAGGAVVARLAIDYAKKNIKVGERRRFIGKTGAVVEAEVVKALVWKDKKNAVLVRVAGEAKYSGRSQFCLEEGDELGRGFLMR